MRGAFAGVLVFALCGFARLDDAELSLSSETLKALENITLSLARYGRERDVAELTDMLRELGHPEASVEKLEAKCGRSLSRARENKKAQPGLAKKAARIAGDMAREMTAHTGKNRDALARLVLKLDGNQRDARDALGHVRHEGRWGPPELPELMKGREKVHAAIQKARHMTFEIDVGESDLEPLERLLGQRGTRVQWKNLSLHTPLPPERARNILQDICRAVALSMYIRFGEWDIPRFHYDTTILHAQAKEDYLGFIDYYLKKGKISREDAENARQLGAWPVYEGDKLLFVNRKPTSIRLKPSIFNRLYYDWAWFQYKWKVPECFSVGHINWISLTLFGVKIPGIAWFRESDGGLSSRKRKYAKSREEEERREERTRVMLTESSLIGCRSWMMEAVASEQDPSLESCLAIEEVGKVTGLYLLKSTVVVEYLQDLGVFGPRFYKKQPERDSKEEEEPTDKEIFESALSQSLDAFEAKWRLWLLPERPGLAQRLMDKVQGGTPDREESKLLSYLDQLREAAWPEKELGPYVPLKMEQSLSDGALLHARYLDLHPDQRSSWPEAHEEYTDREGFTSKGCWAGLHSVIAPGSFSRHPEGAVDAWMATFYHRLPLLHPGLARVGWGATEGIAVLDVGTLVLPDKSPYTVVWPCDGMENVPRRFLPELPNPVPGEDQGEWGYPVTLQQHLENEDPDVGLTLYEGRSAAYSKEVPCLFSSPSKPSNPVMAPPNAFCLIPKEMLKSKTAYTVQAEDRISGTRFTWSFTTGR